MCVRQLHELENMLKYMFVEMPRLLKRPDALQIFEMQIYLYVHIQRKCVDNEIKINKPFTVFSLRFRTYRQKRRL